MIDYRSGLELLDELYDALKDYERGAFESTTASVGLLPPNLSGLYIRIEEWLKAHS